MENNILLPDAPNFSKFLDETFDGDIKIIENKEVRQGFSSSRNKFSRFFLGRGRWENSPIDEDWFYEVQEMCPRVKNYFVGPFQKCLRTKIKFIPPKQELEIYRQELRQQNLADPGEPECKRDEETVESIIKDFFREGELRAYPEFRDKAGNVPISYVGFGVGHQNMLSGSTIGLTYGPYSSLVKLMFNFTAPVYTDTRGPIWKRNEWKRFDKHDIPFP